MNLNQMRGKIDEIDDKILELITARVEIALQIGKIKKREEKAFLVPDREKEIFKRLLLQNTSALPERSIRAIYREILSASLALQYPLCIAYLGPEATFTHLAALKRFGSSLKYLPVKRVADVFLEVGRNHADYGVVPVENSMEGVITHTLDMFIDSELKIWAEVLIQVSHNLLSNTSIDEIRQVYSHPQAFAQCRLWLESNLPGAALKEVSSTAEAARLAASEKDSAAIASDAASQLYNLESIVEGIEDSGPNFTRFLVISQSSPEKTGNDKTSIMFSIKDRVGALHDMLRPFTKHNISLTKIESRPSGRKAWDYFFFVDMKGHQADTNVARALKELEEDCIYVKILGSYPAA